MSRLDEEWIAEIDQLRADLAAARAEVVRAKETARAELLAELVSKTSDDLARHVRGFATRAAESMCERAAKVVEDCPCAGAAHAAKAIRSLPLEET